MKAKPQTSQFEFKKDPSEFIEAGDEIQPEKASTGKIQQKVVKEKPKPNQLETRRVYREQKVFRLPIDLINELRREAYERSVKKGSRVTETEIMEEALRKYFKI